MKKLLTGVLLLFSTLCFSQTDSIRVQCKVVDDCDKDKPIPGATVIIRSGLNNLVRATDVDGVCSFKLKSGSSYLVFVRSIGYNSYNTILFKPKDSSIIKLPLTISCQ